jgi:hypothetical protein
MPTAPWSGAAVRPSWIEHTYGALGRTVVGNRPICLPHAQDFGLAPNRARDTLAAEKTLEWFRLSMARLDEVEEQGSGST